MKKITLTALLPLALLSASSAFAGTQTCAMKIDAIQRQMDEARQQGNVHQAAGLQTALTQTKAHCTDAGQAERAERKVRSAQEDVRRSQEDVRRAEQNLRDARARNDEGKISKHQEKLSEKQRRLREKQDDLCRTRSDRTALNH
ncbi:DUF1090 domain-containing protein [Stenotrophomonas sp. 169]|uniref:DUF1090 domain-containing protein n=1 Tax=Stenotrophomonas sp. 169 TaxID=2770322 RepID=UPI0016624041|nr:DUF1090 domain-containing protein [Stenotrophomonas sp. 169]QNR96961.1 DUF1090 domain-containing protein [Stenotrophomonas sp. 169]